jgi:arginyl-tRNA synthetase
MKIEDYVRESVRKAIRQLALVDDESFPVELVRTRSREHGDVATNVAMKLAGTLKKNPKDIALDIRQALDMDEKLVLKTEIAGPGFINFFYTSDLIYQQLEAILKQREKYGRNSIGAGEKAQVEFVSANPTGPLTIGHGRQAVLGDTIANLLSVCGYDVSREYYFNDAGRQMRVLGDSVRLRYLELLGEKAEFPEELYQGEYIRDIAQQLKREHGASLRDAEQDPIFKDTAEQFIFEDIKKTLARLGIEFDSFFNEKSLYDDGKIDDVISRFREKDLAFDQDGATWLRASGLGLEEDRVIVKSSGEPTYRLPDIAYHTTKFDRGFDLMVDLFGADHIATYPDVLAGIGALGYDQSKVKVLIHQFVTLTEGDEKVKMSTRKANFVTLDELMDLVGEEVTRYFFLMRSMNSHLNFDLTLASTHSDENPVYYIQYAHARIVNIERFASNQGISLGSRVNLELLGEEVELDLIRKMIEFPVAILRMHDTLEPQVLTQYLTELATLFHKFYFEYRVVTDEAELSQARLALVAAAKTIFGSGLNILGISAPERM